MGLEHVNRRGDRYYVLQGRTKNGKPKFYCSRKPEGNRVDRLPEGYEVYESPSNGLVAVRKVRPSRILTAERELVERLGRELASVPVIVEVNGDSVVVYAHYSPELRFTLTDDDERSYGAERWCYRGSIDGWFPLRGHKSLEKVARSYLPHLGEESFFELF